jgi:diguanylate cyclase (GGDEF)-like protein
MSLKSEYATKIIIYTILAITLFLIYINYQTQINLTLLIVIGLLSIILLIIQNQNSKRHFILNSIYDNTTKLYNRQYFIAELSTTYERAIRYDSPVSILIISIENLFEFKSKTREQILRDLGNYMLKHGRQSDIICRYDDNKIIMLLPMTDYLHATIAKDRFINGLSNFEFDTNKKPIFKFSTTQNNQNEDRDEFLARAFDGY